MQIFANICKFYLTVTDSYSLSFQEMASYPVLPPQDIEMLYLPEETKKKIEKKKIHKPEIEEPPEIKKLPAEIPEPIIKPKVKEKKKPKSKPKEEPEEVEEEEEIMIVTKLPVKKERKRREILGKVCSVEICKPEICCADLEGKFAKEPGNMIRMLLFIRRIIAFVEQVRFI